MYGFIGLYGMDYKLQWLITVSESGSKGVLN